MQQTRHQVLARLAEGDASRFPENRVAATEMHHHLQLRFITSGFGA